MAVLIAPSILAADFSDLKSAVKLIDSSVAEWIHIDVMDGVFVPNITFGFEMVHALKKLTSKVLDVHLMIVDPDRYIPRFREAGAEVITVHYEACQHLHRTVQLIKSTGAKAGIALNPHTPVQVLEDILQDIDLVLLMSVNPGFGGQQFIPNTENKILKLNELILDLRANTLIQVDGGVQAENASRLVELGADVLVAGNAVFSAPDPKKMIKKLHSCG